MFVTPLHSRIADLRRRGAFTLVEMLSVMAVIVVMLLVTLPAFRGFNESQGRRGAVGNLMGVLDRARMMAVSDGLASYVVFARKPINGGGAQVNEKLWGRAYAIFEEKDNVSFTLVQKTPWIYLPIGVAFKMDATSTSTADGGTSTTTASVTDQKLTTDATSSDPLFPVMGAALPSNATSSPSVPLPYWKFDATGAVEIKSLDPAAGGMASATDQQNAYLRLLLFNGYVDGAGKEVSTHNQNGKGNKTAFTLEEIDVNPVTGRAKYVANALDNLAVSAATPVPSPGS